MKNTLRAAGQWIVDRAKEPSTWAGVAVAVGSMSFIPHASDLAQQIPTVGAGVAGVIAIIVKEKAK